MTQEFSPPAPPSTDLGMTATDLLQLPESLQPIARLLLQRLEPLTPEQAADLLQTSPTITRRWLEDLVQRGLVEPLPLKGKLHYQKRAGRRRGGQISEEFFQKLVPGAPLSVICNSSNEVVAGEEFFLSATVNNQGNRHAVVDAYIEEGAEAYEWCDVPYDRLGLAHQPMRTLGTTDPADLSLAASGTSGEVLFQFRVPPSTPARVYTYTLVIDAPDHYPEDTPLYFEQTVRVLPAVQQVRKVKDPTFSLQPATTSAKPAIVQPGVAPLEIKVSIHNLSNRVDRFRLNCPDLPEHWYTIRYPEALETPGVVLEADGLALNPTARGDIYLLISPPIDTQAGVYSPTIRVQSVNNPQLLLLDLLYLQIQPIYALNLELRTLRGQVRHTKGQYEICLNNTGNTDREVRLSAVSAADEIACDYQLTPTEQWLIPAQTTEIAELTVQPSKWWQRPLFGRGRLVTFVIEAIDAESYPILNNPTRGVLLWSARPWWQFLLLLLATLGLLGALLWLIWSTFLRPVAPPKILEFGAADARYEEAAQEAIRLNWQIRNPKAVQELRLSGLSEGNATAGKAVVYNLSQGVPNELKPFCGDKLPAVLICRGVPTAARKAGNYTFELALVPKNAEGEPTETKKTEAIAIQPPPPQAPIITEFKIDNREVGSKYLIPLNPRQPIKKLVFAWKVKGDRATKVELLPAPGSVRPEGSLAYLVTQRIGAETFTLKATNATGQQTSRSVTIETFDPASPMPTPTLGELPKLPGGGALPPVPIPGSATMPPLLPAPGAGKAPTTPGSSSSGAASGSSSGSPTPAPTPTPTSPPNLNAPMPTDRDRLSPSELPPQFD